MQKKCSKCGRTIKEAGRLIRVTWLGFRAPLCKKCREELKKSKKSRFERFIVWRRKET
jgi:tRNA(Ile2) C34 agmatinyltransferase TiaS